MYNPNFGIPSKWVTNPYDPTYRGWRSCGGHEYIYTCIDVRCVAVCCLQRVAVRCNVFSTQCYHARRYGSV